MERWPWWWSKRRRAAWQAEQNMLASAAVLAVVVTAIAKAVAENEAQPHRNAHPESRRAWAAVR